MQAAVPSAPHPIQGTFKPLSYNEVLDLTPGAHVLKVEGSHLGYRKVRIMEVSPMSDGVGVTYMMPGLGQGYHLVKYDEDEVQFAAIDEQTRLN